MAISKIPSAGFQDNVKFRNLFINGDMSIAQRGTSQSSVTSGGYYTCDRWRIGGTVPGTWTQTQSTDVPTGQGFAKSVKMDCTTADASLSSNQSFTFTQLIEGQNLQYLKKGTSSAENVTLSFWVKSNKTGTYIAELFDNDNTRHISKSYTINSANTWEKKTITYDGDTTGAFDNDNALSLYLQFWLAAGTDFTSGTLATSWSSRVNTNIAVGQVNLADSTDNEWYITGVQLEAGEVASDFEFLPTGIMKNLCNRYYQLIASGTSHHLGATAQNIVNLSSYSTATAYGVFHLSQEMRSAPSIDQVVGTDYYKYYNAGSSSDNFNEFQLFSNATAKVVGLNNQDSMSISSGQSGWVVTNKANTYFAFDAEL